MRNTKLNYTVPTPLVSSGQRRRRVRKLGHTLKSGDQWDKNIFSGKGASLIFGFMLGNFILQCTILKSYLGWEARTSHK